MINARLVSACAVLVALQGGALHASGFVREGLNSTGVLFSNDRFVLQGQVAVVAPQRSWSLGSNGYGLPGSTETDANPTYLTGSLSVKARIFNGFDCMARLSEPYGNDTETNKDWAAGNFLTESRIGSLAVDGTCSYRAQVSEGVFLRGLAGLRVSDFEFFRSVSLPSGTGFIPDGNIFDLRSDGMGYGWRAGIAVEIPEYAMIGSLIYSSAVSFDLTGQQRLLTAGGLVTNTAISAPDVALPQSVELRLQSGLAPDWIGTIGVRWQDWSELSTIRVDNVLGGAGLATSILNNGYSDGWTVEAAVGHKINEKWGAGVSLGWDQGIDGGYTDTWTLGAAVTYDVSKNVRLELNGGVSYLTAGSDSGTDNITGASYSYRLDGSFAYAGGVRVRISF